MSTTMWNPTTHSDYETLKGFDVNTSDIEKLGTIAEVCHPALDMPAARGQHYVRVEPGTLTTLFTDAEDVYVPERPVRTVDPKDDLVVLEVAKAQVTKTDWSRPANYDTFRRV